MSSKLTGKELEEAALKSKRSFFRVWSIIGIIALALATLYLLQLLATPVSVLIWTAVFVFCLRVPVAYFEKKGFNRAIGTLFAYIIMFAILAVVILLLTTPVFDIGGQIAAFFDSLPIYIGQVQDLYQSLYNQYFEILRNEYVLKWLESVSASLSSAASSFASSSAENVVVITSGVMNSFVAIGLGLVLAFWILMELPALGKEVMRLISEENHQDARLLHATFTRVMGGYIYATFLQVIIVTVGLTIVLWIIGAPNPAALGFIAGLFTILPIIGPFVGGFIVALMCLFNSWITALIALVAIIVIENLVFTFVTPNIMANSVDVHPALSLFVVVVGSSLGTALSGGLGAILGMLIAVPAAAVMKSLFVYYYEKKHHRQIIATDGVFFKGEPSGSEGVESLIEDATSSHDFAKITAKHNAKHADEKQTNENDNSATPKANNDKKQPKPKHEQDGLDVMVNDIDAK